MASRWSHAHGKTGAELVPSSWQPTRAQSAKDKTLFYRDNQATGCVRRPHPQGGQAPALSAQVEVEPAEALVRLRAHTFATGHSATAVACDILDRRLRVEAD